MDLVNCFHDPVSSCNLRGNLKSRTRLNVDQRCLGRINYQLALRVKIASGIIY